MPAQIKLSDWKIFEVLGEVGSFRKASEILRLDSANIKRSVDKLESTLNIRLFNRTPRGVKLTEEGLSYQYKIKELMSSLEIKSPSAPARRVVSVQFDPKLSFSPLLLLLSRYNQIDPTLIFDCSKDNSKDYLSVNLLPNVGAEGCRRTAVISPRLLNGKTKPITFKQLFDFPYITLSNDLNSENWEGLKAAIVVNNADEAIRAAVLGVGFCFVFSEDSLRRQIASGSLIRLPVELPERPWNPSINSSSKELREFIAFHQNLFLNG